VGAFGASNVDGTQLREALDVAAPTRYEWVQNSYSLLDRGAEREVLPVCAAEGLGFTPFSPLAGGWLTGKYRRGEAPPAGSRMTLRPEPYEHLRDDRTFDALERFEQLARERGSTPAALALAWLLADPRIPAVVVGPRRPEHLQPALDALEHPLDQSERDELGALFEG
jgi:aryl-alcohol dehydrogenase-like predicted oxidoreductase